ncbi:MAG: YcxB family protein [Planctomycetes bacterium]|nr:YcxB family protein [Planctomycetota bacterium]
MEPASNLTASTGASGTTGVRIVYQLDADSLLAGAQVLSEIDPRIREQIGRARKYLILVPLVGLGLAYKEGWFAILICGLIFVYFLLTLSGSIRKDYVKRLKSAIEQGAIPNLGRPTEMVVDAVGVTTMTANETLRYPWDEIKEIVEKGNCLFVFTANTGAIILPQAAIVEGSFDSCLDMIKTHHRLQTVEVGGTFENARFRADQNRAKVRRGRIVRAFAGGLAAAFLASPGLHGFAQMLMPRIVDSEAYPFFAPIAPAAIGVAIALWVASKVSLLDYETRCRRCQYVLKSLVEPRCPECGERI